MKRILLIAALLSSCLFIFAEEGKGDEEKFKFSGVSGINFSQTAMSKDWAAGGDDSYAGTIYLNASLKKKTGNWAWENKLNLEYGLNYTESGGRRKSGDKIDFDTKLGYSVNDKWFYTIMADYKSQFAKGYSYSGKERGPYISRFMSPAYSKISLGIDYKPKEWLSAYFSPVAGKMTFVLDDSLTGNFGVDKGDHFRAELGASLSGRFEKEVVQNVKVISSVSFFTAYDKNFGNIDVEWDVLVSMKINKFLSATLSTSLRYDDDVKRIRKDDEGNPIEKGPVILLKETLGIGLAYNF